MSPDIMHDILEGVLQLHLKWLLKYLIEEERMFTLDTLSGRLLSFYYEQSDTQNRPTIISHQTLSSPSNTVKQSCKVLHVYILCLSVMQEIFKCYPRVGWPSELYKG